MSFIAVLATVIRHMLDLQYVTDVLEFSETDRILQPGNNVNSLFARGDFTGNILAVRLDASVY